MRRITILKLALVASFFAHQSYAQNFSLSDAVKQSAINYKVQWKIAPVEAVKDSGFLYPGYDVSTWVSATVPGTVFGDYVKAGIEAAPEYADNIYKIDKKKYNKNFYYRTEFNLPSKVNAQRLWLNFEGINSKGEIYLNGTKLGTLDGFMMRGKYEISSLLKKGANVLAVKVYVPVEPLVNWASPMYMSAGGWDWMPPVPGLEMGITDDVFVTTSGAVTIKDPWIRTLSLNSQTSANMALSAEFTNTSNAAVSGVVKAIITPGNISFTQNVSLAANETKTISFNNKVFNNVKLWWPNGYGDPNLYKCQFQFTVNGKISDSSNTNFGIRKFTYDSSNKVLKVLCNGQRIFIKGGNWGMSEFMLRCKGSEYETRMKLHKDMGFNMIRSWCGSNTDEEFYDACDKYGMMLWDDFWLNNFFTAIRDVPRFDSNVTEKVKRVRPHACLAVWCGDNENYAFPEIEAIMSSAVAKYDLGDRLYQSCSNQGNLSGSGLWANLSPSQYFTGPTNFFNLGFGLRTEIGTPVFVTFESFKEFMPQANWWPRNQMWDKHFFGPSAANGNPDQYQNTINNKYGTATGIQDFCRKAQLVNIETNKAMFEGWQDNIWNNASGLLTWMSQSAYPALVWQTYDYYYDCNGAYWGTKHACEPLHIQWSAADDSVKVINTTGKNVNKLTAVAKVYNLDGSEAINYAQNVSINSVKDTATYCFNVFANNKDNLAYTKSITATSSVNGNTAAKANDGNLSSRWESSYNDNQSITLDLGAVKTISEVILNWEGAYGKSYKIQTSTNGSTFTDVFSTTTGDGGMDDITFAETNARYVRMLGLKRGSAFGYSIYEFEVYAPGRKALTNTHFLRLQLKNDSGNVVSDNFYWRSLNNIDTALNRLPVVNLNVNSSTGKSNGNYTIDATIKNPANSKGVAFDIHVQVVSTNTGKRILPVFMNDNYFTIIKGETKNLHVEFDTALLAKGDTPKLLIEQYADGNSAGVQSVPVSKAAVAVHEGTAFPNPFKDNVFIPVDMKANGKVTIAVYNAAGKVETQFTKAVSKGSQNIEWNGLNSKNQKVNKGVYIATVTINSVVVKTVKLMKVE